jgi:hypothetical protein
LSTRVSSLSDKLLIPSGKELIKLDVTNDSANNKYKATIHMVGIENQRLA